MIALLLKIPVFCDAVPCQLTDVFVESADF